MSKRRATTISLFQLMSEYDTDDKAVDYFSKIRWNGKLVCVRCGSDTKITVQKKHGNYWCGHCRSYFNIFTNTPLERSKVDVRKWLFASYLLLTSRKGVSSLQLSKELGVQQRTAWYMLHRLRVVCGDDLEALRVSWKLMSKGIVEVDEAYFGGKESNKHANKKQRKGRGAVGKQAVLGMRERGGKVKAMSVNKTDKETLQGAIDKHIEKGATVFYKELVK